MTTIKKEKLSQLQLELLKIYSFNPTQKDLIEIKKLLAIFYANKLTENVKTAIQEKNITNEDFENWINE